MHVNEAAKSECEKDSGLLLVINIHTCEFTLFQGKDLFSEF